MDAVILFEVKYILVTFNVQLLDLHSSNDRAERDGKYQILRTARGGRLGGVGHLSILGSRGITESGAARRSQASRKLDAI